MDAENSPWTECVNMDLQMWNTQTIIEASFYKNKQIFLPFLKAVFDGQLQNVEIHYILTFSASQIWNSW